VPTVVFAINETEAYRPYLVHAYYNAPLKPGQTLADLKSKDMLPQFLVKTPVFDDERSVVSWAYGGSERVAKKGEKRYLAGDEVEFLNRNYPGLVEIVVGGAGENDAVPALFEQAKDAQRERDVALAEAQQAKNALTGLATKAQQAEQAAAQAAAIVNAREIEVADLKAKLAAAEALLAEKPPEASQSKKK
jgi:hypothetical protein